MVQYICDNPQVENEFKALCQQITAGGGFVHDDLIVEQKGRHIAIRAPAHIAPDAVIIQLPRKLLLPYSKFDVATNGNDFVLEGCDDDVTDIQRHLFEGTLRLYNLTGKLAEHRDISLMQLVHKDPQVIEWLVDGRDDASKALLEELAQQDFETALMQSYFKTRFIGVNFDDSAGGKKEHCLMPLIDFVNHHTKAGVFDLPPDGVSDLSITKGTVADNSDECFVRYGYLDALDTLLNYDFPDQHAVFVRSVPMQIELEGVCTVLVKSGVSLVKHKLDALPPALQGLGMYLPSMAVNTEQKRLELGYLMIPQQGAPRSMRRILAAGVSMMLPDASQPEVMGYVQTLEKEIIRHNIIFYNSLDRKLANHNIDQDFKTIYDNIGLMIRTQLDNINKYPFIEQANA